MADISFYQYLEAAFRHKLKNNTATSFKDLKYSLPYESKGATRGIFEYARKVLPSFYPLHFPDTEEGHLQMAKDFIEKLDRHKDAELERYFDPTRTPKEHAQTIAEAQAASQSSTWEEPPSQTLGTSGLTSQVSQAAGGLPFGMPAASAPSTPRVPRIVRDIPHTPETPKIEIANKSGVVAEAPSSKIAIANSSGIVVGEHPITPSSTLGPSKPETPRLVIANSSGAVFEKPPSTISIANKSGAVTGEHAIKTPSAVRRFNIRGFKIPNSVKNFGSKAGVFFQRNIGKYATAGRIAAGVSGVIGGITGGALTGGHPMGVFGGFGLGAVAPSWIKSGGAGKFLSNAGNKGINAFGNISSQISRGKSNLTMSPASKKILAGSILGLLLLFILIGGIGGTSGGSVSNPGPGPESGPDISSCKFTRAGNPQLIKSSILAGWISNAAASAGIPPQVLASVAMHENPDFVTNVDNNHDGIKNNQLCNKGKIFCEKDGQVLHSKPNEDDPCTYVELADLSAGTAARNAQAVGLMQLLDIYNPGKDLCSITESLNIAATKLKADGLTSQPTQDQVNKAINSYYNSCTYDSYSYCNEVWQDLQNCQTQSQITPPADGDYTGWMRTKLGIKMNDGFTPDAYKWAYEILARTMSVSPGFKDLIHKECPIVITLEPTADISHAEECTIPLSYNSGEKFFKFLLIHELAHKINTTAGQYNDKIIAARTADSPQDTKEGNGFLTYYSEHAASAPDKICGDGQDNGNRADEEFADSVAYFINNSTEEMNMHSADDIKGKCGVKWPDNPFQKGNRYTAHYNLVINALK